MAKNKEERVLVIGDTHCPGMLEDYPDFLWETYKSWGCNRVVHIGDVVDLHGLSYHQKEFGMPSLENEIEQAKSQLKRLYKMFPDVDVMTGNHDSLTRRKAADVGIPSGMLREQSDYWELPKWKFHDRYSWMNVDGVLYGHGEAGGGGKTPALNQAIQQFNSVVIGHFHACFGVHWTANLKECIFGMSVGTGMDWKYMGANYGRKFAKKPIIGCGVVIEGCHPYVERMII